MDNIITVENLVKRYNDFPAVNDISFSVKNGEIFGFLGPNGAGKSTTIQILCTLLPLTSGRAVLNGFDVEKDPLKVRQSIGLVFQDFSLDDRLTAVENLYFHGMLYNVPRKVLQERMDNVLEMVQLTDRKKDLVKKYSGGMKRRLEIARGLLHYPRVLFLDEPTIGLDPQTRTAIWEHILHLRDSLGLCIFLTTHYMDEAEHCDRIAVIDHGKIIALDTPSNLKTTTVGGDRITLTADDNHFMREELKNRFGLEAVLSDDRLIFQVEQGESFIPRLVAAYPEQVKTISLHEPTLDDVFLALTGRGIRDAFLNDGERFRQRRLRRR
ncbi:daunorubicin resistance abc transporter ATP-binding subunit [Heliomicrobium modesticaldum Ice1]|uniref:Daunorubicin resistance abc transporter ATP-binding subunit n=1 Tax=Heliobacterium modesticaldum (strain ATCC 51547 / Ice1) TaxID=498761 RepID=B0TG94_HELMI|nr:daunorubicin resistance protein DrrA family ABC transporter ATP-binding protein [Heliomicrobium modesticaldum]ABZ84590.1 daunorubicin resistance abc transporter ATP-binding subunit [Heliomicrobium modesticaldum Ice1]